MTNKEKLIDALKRAGYEKVGDRFRIKYWIGVNTYQEAYEKKDRPNVFCFENDNELKIHNKRGTHRIDDIVSVTDVYVICRTPEFKWTGKGEIKFRF